MSVNGKGDAADGSGYGWEPVGDLDGPSSEGLLSNESPGGARPSEFVIVGVIDVASKGQRDSVHLSSNLNGIGVFQISHENSDGGSSSVSVGEEIVVLIYLGVWIDSVTHDHCSGSASLSGRG